MLVAMQAKEHSVWSECSFTYLNNLDLKDILLFLIAFSII